MFDENDLPPAIIVITPRAVQFIHRAERKTMGYFLWCCRGNPQGSDVFGNSVRREEGGGRRGGGTRREGGGLLAALFRASESKQCKRFDGYSQR